MHRHHKVAAPILIVFFWFIVTLWAFKNFGNLHSFKEILDATHHLDVGWYEEIVLNGYRLIPENTAGQSTVFFPLFPFITSPFVHIFGMEPLLALNLVQKLSLLLMAGLIFKWSQLEEISPKESLIGLLLHPALVFFFVPYTESLYLTCLFGLLIAWRTKKTLLIFILGLLLGLCRPTGLFLLPAVGITLLHAVLRYRKESKCKQFLNQKFLLNLAGDAEFKSTFKLLSMAALGAFLSLALISVLMHISVNDWFAFYRYRTLWKEEPGIANLVSFLKLDLGSGFPRIVVSWLTLWGCYLLFKKGKVFESALCSISILLPAYQGKIGDIVRYSLGAAPAWILIYEHYKTSRLAQIALIGFSVSIGMVYLLFWTQRGWPG